MTRQEAIKILSVLKAAYPNSYKGMTKDEANGTVNIWATQFANMPYSVVSIAINKLISTSPFPPAINEVKEKIRSMYFEAWQMKRGHEQVFEIEEEYGIRNDQDLLDDKTLAIVEEIIRVCEPMRTKQLLEPTLTELLQGYNDYLEGSSCADTKLLQGE